jgi:hypothetical protein
MSFLQDPTQGFGSTRAPSLDSGIEFEINTDAALLDPTFGDVFDGHDRRFGLAISHFKSTVRGRSYDNDQMTLRVGKGGYYAQSKRFPLAFFGDSAKAEVSLVDEVEARAVVWEAVAHYRAEEAQSLVCAYDSDDPNDVFLGYRVADDRRYEFGGLKSDLPLHLRILFDSTEDVPMLGARTGVLIYQRTRSGKHVVVRAPGRRRPLLTGVFGS